MINPTKLQEIDTLTTLALPEQENRWLEGRKRMEEYEMEYQRELFRVENRKALLLKDILAGVDVGEAGASKSAAFAAINQLTAEGYGQLIEKYLRLTAARYPEGLREQLLASQETWAAYRGEMMALWEATGTGMEKSIWYVDTTQKRLQEVFELYQNVADG